MKVIIKKVDRVFDGFFKVDRAVLQFEKYDGTISRETERLCMQRGNAVAVLLINPEKKTIILTEQFRYPAYVGDPSRGWLVEVVAGTVDPGESPVETVTREILEEVGYEIEDANEIQSFYASPGGSSELIYLYCAEVSDDCKITEGGGVEAELEDLRVIELTFHEAYHRLDNGLIHDAKTLIALHWFRNSPRYAELMKQGKSDD
ncbi:MAG: NUDIX hydrolase [candidate division KSB1 bacterium]|jgi:ADP-ribose pyrophosphatase|nr:NUDIX hydrolase [candidate division KSB1 bacterium]